MQARGGVINSNVVRATADAIIRSKHSPGLQHLRNFSMPHSWVQTVYKRMGYTRRMGTTARPPVPKGLYDECRASYLKRRVKSVSIIITVAGDFLPLQIIYGGKTDRDFRFPSGFCISHNTKHWSKKYLN